MDDLGLVGVLPFQGRIAIIDQEVSAGEGLVFDTSAALIQPGRGSVEMGGDDGDFHGPNPGRETSFSGIPAKAANQMERGCSSEMVLKMGSGAWSEPFDSKRL